MRMISVSHVTELLKVHGFDQFIRDLMDMLTHDFLRWQDFNKIARPAFHVPDGVIELMPIADQYRFAFKYVNGHPKNPAENKQTIVATGQLANIDDGHPIMMSEMTLLTALRTAATSALATDRMAKKQATKLALIGTGAQSDFQVLATRLVRPIKEVRFYDIDQQAMERFEQNMRPYGFDLVACQQAQQAVEGADIVTVCTACKQHSAVIRNEWLSEGTHINALGGDCPGKTELEKDILFVGKIVVEYFEQSFIEGEIQQLTAQQAKEYVYAELWEILAEAKFGRQSMKEITIFDSVGFALEDYSVLNLVYQLSEQYQIGLQLDMLPTLSNPKDLYSVLRANT